MCVHTLALRNIQLGAFAFQIAHSLEGSHGVRAHDPSGVTALEGPNGVRVLEGPNGVRAHEGPNGVRALECPTG